MSLRKLPEIRAFQHSDLLQFDPPDEAVAEFNAEIRAAKDEGDNVISIYGSIGRDPFSDVDNSERRISAALASIGRRDVIVNINSPGGNFLSGLAIYNLLRAHPARVTINVLAMAGSAASVIAMAGDEIAMADGSFIMVHKASAVVMGNEYDAKDAAELLAEVDAAMAEIYAPAVRFAFLTGCRRAEIVSLTWQRVDFFGKTITVTGKGSKKRILPMTQPVYDLLWGEKDNHPTAVFTYVVQATRKHLALVRGERRPITMEGFKTAWRRYKADCGVEDFRFHDTRHTAATRTLRSGNLKVVQQMLGHEDITTTAKYAHAMLDDMRTAMEAANSIPSSKPDPKEASN
ncbi:tyrosine-type recombinase/integrase [Aquamicrobium sp. NLF2-7]|uniref:head maturation protease, ClpP-related n=1 Tax=Aquamicrobium sp. NLF2-7 TaxID=2918753 RepID=UPI001EFACEC0|nr:head maturation protease, ClpP-related [Aquamicrobium sp. NLF2-7]MCG8270342.1 tyrosine-type recombinase/integrase [Aquamicrobium sp. NLF2-7]